jgi:hypothetical protein
VADGFEEGHFENLSTQAVMDFIRNVRVEEDGDSTVQIAADDIENFNINRSNVTVEEASHSLGNFSYICLFE